MPIVTSHGGSRPRPAPPSIPGASEIFQVLRDGRPRTRAELAQITGLARSTVAARVDALMTLGFVSPTGGAVSTGGRPPSLFALNPAARVVIGADLGATHAIVILADLAGEELARERSGISIADGPDAVLGWFVSAIGRLLASAGRATADLAAIGIGLPGPVEHDTGRPINPPIMPGWDRFDVPGFVQETFAVPVLVDNDVNIMALGEQSANWPEIDDLVFIKVATGIGAGIISGGILQRGAQGTAGDLGHVRVASGGDAPCRCGNLGCLEAVASGPALAASLGGAVQQDLMGSQDVIDLVRSGDARALQAIRQAGRDIGDVVAMCINLINPSVVVIGGSLAQAGEHLLAGIREVVYTRSLPLATEHLRIAPSVSGQNAGVTGAAVLAISHVLSPAAIDAVGAVMAGE
ncbi:ROK family protein [Arthrobacter agilis]|uniref:ROK family transcriptional regulator n=1 Tax=Arthrobacter agilis TaxID=37921 RepID=UPI000B34AAA9|nr:ROK family protein [Arthrobacter agilis]OUM43629.1 sugar kinase [Arthrobacter agilis]PPB46855.1 sugar kinase [Arthrobacter agilis]TPV25031.1 ROK family protein [Arthrobacter agilis]VDR31027.1 Glucokinase [Arthrobacter agilis]